MNVRFQDTSVFGVTILMLGLAASAILPYFVETPAPVLLPQ